MSTLYLDRPGLDIGLEGRHIRLRSTSGSATTIPLTGFDRMVVLGRMRLDSSLLGALAERGIAVILLSGRSHRRRGLLLGAGGQDASRRVQQYRSCTDPAASTVIIRDLLAAKLASQLRGMAAMLDARPDQRRVLVKKQRTLRSIGDSLRVAGSDGILGLEGAAARAWYEALAAVLPLDLEFRGRNRRPPRDPCNALLSLAYTLIHGDAVAMAWAAGLDPMIGFLHQPLHGRESLACDLIEPLRPRIDLAFWRMLAERKIRVEHFTIGENGCYLTRTGRAHFYPLWEALAPPWRRYLRRSCLGLVRHLAAPNPGAG